MRILCRSCFCLIVAGVLGADPEVPIRTAKNHVEVRGIYGGVPTQLMEDRGTLESHGVNAVWIGSTQLDADDIKKIRREGARVFAEFNTMHEAGFLEEHPDAAPIGPDGLPSPPPDGWQGLCPTHPEYRRERMEAFRKALATFEIDGIWLDYHHAHASWEQAEPNLPDTCFCPRCLARFEVETEVVLPDGSVEQVSSLLLGELKPQWVQWRCDVFTDWVREFAEIRDASRPSALLGTFHCPWSDDDRAGALREKLAIDLKAQSEFIDVFSPMPYHARFGHAEDPSWISKQTAWLGEFLAIEGTAGEEKQIWPIVQLSNWGENVAPEQVSEILDHGTRLPATGVMVFAWNSLAGEVDKVDRMTTYYKDIAGRDP